jgi:serine/threonine protein kinase/Tfp pilus assembly protein PilF
VFQTFEADISVTDETQWSRLGNLFDRLLAGVDPETVLASEPDPEMRTAALNLWQHHVRADAEDYLGAPVEFEIAPVFQPGQILLNRFRIERLLGSGGMGEVYLATDERVEDRVALKTIARLLAPSHSIRRRFIAEVQSARRVTHPNVCRIHELFEDGETAFFSMEYVEGVLLPDFLAGRFDARHARPIVRQMAEALLAAHRIGVVHGDFKPANVMIVPGVAATSGVPRAVIMDFGLARALDRAVVPTEEGLSLRAGTVDYMAPELQAGGQPTVRSDIYAFGKVARALLPKQSIWDECTRPMPEDRPGSLDTVVRRLETGTSRRYLIGSLAIATAAAGYAVWPAGPTYSGLPADARILVNGFRSIAGQLPGARLVRSLLLTALEQSPRIRAIADQDLLPALRRLQPAGSLPLAGQALRDLLKQLRAAFWIEGDLRQASQRYSLDVRLMAASGQRVVAASAFRDAPSVIALAQATALWVRKTAGESGQSLAVNPAEVGSYTSEVPEALQKYYDAMEHYAVGEMDQAIPLLEEAVRLDPRFAQAHNMLALTNNARRRYDEGFREIERAMQLAENLPDRERTSIRTNYYRMTEDPVQMVEFANRNLAYHRDEPRCYGVLAQTLAAAGNARDAVGFYRSALALAPDDWMTILLLEGALVESGQYNQALDEFRIAQSRGVPNKWIYNGAGCAYMGLERYDEAIQAFENEPVESENTTDIQGVKIMQGHLEAAIAAMEEHRASARSPMEAYQANEFLCGLYYVTDHPQLARRSVREMADLPSFPPTARSLACAASWARRLGDNETLAKVRASASQIAFRWPNAYTQALETHVKALQSWRSNDLPDARKLLLASSGSAFDVWTLFDLAEFFTQTGQWEAAGQYWENFETHRGSIIANGWFPGVLILGWLYRAVAARGRNERRLAFQCSQKVLDHWSNSNPRLRIVQAAGNINASSKPL